MFKLEDRQFWAYPTESVDCDGITGSALEVYSKSDADAVIAYLQNQLSLARTSLIKSLAKAQHESRHQKYKRCMAMAQVLEHVCPITNRKAKWMDKWHKRWLELAEKFKDVK